MHKRCRKATRCTNPRYCWVVFNLGLHGLTPLCGTAQASVEASGGAITTLRAERDAGTGGLDMRAYRDRITRHFDAMRDHLATIHMYEIEKAAAQGLGPPEPGALEEVLEQLETCDFPWQTGGAAASALPHLAARYRDADAEARLLASCYTASSPLHCDA